MRGGLVPCEDQGHRFVAKLLVGHPSLLVFDENHVREEIASVLLVGETLLVHAPDDLFDLGDRPLLPPVLGRGPPVGARDHLVGIRDQDLADVGQRIADGVGVTLADVDVEQRVGDDLEGERVELEAHVSALAFLPAVEHSLGEGDHRGRVGVHALLVKPRQDQLVLALPGLTIVRDETLAEKRLPHRLDVLGLVEVSPVRDVDSVHDRGIAYEHEVANQRARDEHVAVLFMLVDQEPRAVADHLEQAAPEPVPLPSGDWLGRHRAGAGLRCGFGGH